MKQLSLTVVLAALASLAMAQKNLSPQQLLELNRVSAVGLTKDKKSVVYRVSQYDVYANKKTTKYYLQGLKGGAKKEI